ncbi:DUF2188 domain-containing protein [Pseudomonas aeruginosa]|uniref:DUF2188 domain-containing protein n=1 Tax=Pseudomonas aeruginosa TaxID=287 RepID=UPI000580EFE4|nr:DUF2188 domain-containing protein [Pseudomonas aeruginosa]MDV6697228.1 DUF2188 domain-containing protein [Pseudomonas aeruginosa]
MSNYHVVPVGLHWELHIEGSNEALIKADTRLEVVSQLSVFMKRKAGSVKIHTRDDRLEEQRLYTGIDPTGFDQ